MFEKAKPEEVGVSSEWIQKYIGVLERYNLSTHSLLMVRHHKVFCEAYWKPFHKDFLHRMYSDTKSFVGIAMGFLEQDGLIDLDAPLSDFFDEKTTQGAFEEVKNQTIRQMLMMTSGYFPGKGWFARKPKDRVRDYFVGATLEQGARPKIPGTIFDYDSSGSFILGTIIENITGKPFLEYLREKCLDQIGFSKEARCLKCPGGHSWSDSALLCKSTDMAKFITFLMDGGTFQGKQLLNREYLKKAVSNLMDTDETGNIGPDSYGYGYQIWHSRDGGFFFNGMGCQLCIAVPKKDLVMVINSDNQGSHIAKHIIIDRFYEEIAERIDSDFLPENEEANRNLNETIHRLELYSLSGSVAHTVQDSVNGKEFILEDNPMKISKIKFNFLSEGSNIEYTNAQGSKKLYFEIDKNYFGLFPQEGYSDEVGTEYAVGNYYQCATSAKWTGERSLCILVQVIDQYFGRLYMRVHFTEDRKISISMFKVAEDFLKEYEGYACGSMAEIS